MADKAKTPDQVIHEAMGLCWHVGEKPPVVFGGGPDANKFSCCGRLSYFDYPIPDYAKDLRPVFEWMREEDHYSRWQKLQRWFDKGNFKFHMGRNIDMIDFNQFQPAMQIGILAQWIESTRE